ncbi:MAG: bifunctional enoyl-CoA hydratase/phosphate acetyltransferase [Gammaproteobacteria bacterium]|nr:bifunctional enoyl-CoA hydratase/phosphate acetyltransferase [Gammaproteobacteria bacterium]
MTATLLDASAHAERPAFEYRHLNALLNEARGRSPLPVAVVHPVDLVSLQGALEAAKEGLIDPWLVGPQARMAQAAAEAGLDLSSYRVIDTEHSHASAARAVQLVQEGKVRGLMKGSLATAELLAAVMNKEAGLRTERRLSHVFVMEMPNYHKLLLITDAAINIQPDLNQKRDIVQNAIDCARALGIRMPKVAILAAVEKVNPQMPATLDAAALCKMAERGQITGGILDGPLAFDNAISLQAAVTKHIDSPVAGDVDILVAPNLEAGNLLAKQLQYLAGARAGGVVMGARVPIILTSRADGLLERLAATAIAVRLARYQAQQALMPEPGATGPGD